MKNCWLRLKRHDWEATGAFSFARRGVVILCVECGRMTVTTNRDVLRAAEARTNELDEEAERNPHALYLDDPEHYDKRGRYLYWGD